MLSLRSKTFKTCLGLAAWVAFVTALSPTAFAGQQIETGGFSLKVSEKEMKLEHPSDMMWDKYMMWDLPFQRINNRNMPYFELKNDSTSPGPIKQFRLTIGDTRFNFSKAAMGVYALLGSTSPFTAMTSSVNNQGDELVLDFGGNGLAQGESVRFKIDIDVDPSFAAQIYHLPDYRTVLFDMNGLNVYDGNVLNESTADNAHATAMFSIGDVLSAVGPSPFADERVLDQSAFFYNENRRSYRDSGSDTVRTFQLSVQASVIPEPGCILLAGFGLLGLTVITRRPTRSAATV